MRSTSHAHKPSSLGLGALALGCRLSVKQPNHLVNDQRDMQKDACHPVRAMPMSCHPRRQVMGSRSCVHRCFVTKSMFARRARPHGHEPALNGGRRRVHCAFDQAEICQSPRWPLVGCESAPPAGYCPRLVCLHA